MLTDTAIKKAKAKAKPYKMPDADAMYLLVKATKKAKARKILAPQLPLHGEGKTLALGVYPAVSLARAREKNAEASKLLADGIDPGVLKKVNKAMRAERAANSFEPVAREWFAKHLGGKAKSHADKVIRRMERDVFPWIGGKPIAEINAPELLAVLRRIELRGSTDTAHRAMQNAGQIFRYGIATGRCDRDPTSDLRGALAPIKTNHFAAITDPKGVGELLRAVDGFKGTFRFNAPCACLRWSSCAPANYARPNGPDFDLDAAEWRFTASKNGPPHIVPLASRPWQFCGNFIRFLATANLYFRARATQKHA